MAEESRSSFSGRFWIRASHAVAVKPWELQSFASLHCPLGEDLLPKEPYNVGKFVTDFLNISWLDVTAQRFLRKGPGSSVSEILHVQKCLSVALYLKYSFTEDHVALLSSRLVVFREILFAWLIKESFICILSPVTPLECYLSADCSGLFCPHDYFFISPLPQDVDSSLLFQEHFLDS